MRHDCGIGKVGRAAAVFVCVCALILWGCGDGGNGNGGTDASVEDAGLADSSAVDGESPPLVDQNWQRDPGNPVVEGDGNLIHHVADPWVIHDQGMFRMWFGFVGADHSRGMVGYAESADGQTFNMRSTPVLEPSTDATAWDNQNAEIPTVVKDDAEPDPNRRYKMWYGGSSWLEDPAPFRVGLAFSPDGISWTRLPGPESPIDSTPFVHQPGLVMEATDTPGDYGVNSDPAVVLHDGTFHIWYSAFGTDVLYISYAHSSDGINWVKDPGVNPVVQHTPGSWEESRFDGLDGNVVHPTVLWDDGFSMYLMWYGVFDETANLTYRGIGFAYSEDGTTWGKLPDPVFSPSPSSPGEQVGLFPAPSVVFAGGTYHLYCGGVDSNLRLVINHATLQ